MKNFIFLYILLFTGLTSCTALRRGTAAATPAEQKPVAASNTTDPVFIENISIATDKKATRKAVRSQPVPPTSYEGSAIPGISLELAMPQQFKYAILLDVPVEEITHSRLVDYIEDWYGTPYRYGGSTKDGIDCSAFTQTFMLAIYGLAIPRTSAEQYKQTKRIKMHNLQEGDLVFFKTRGSRYGISHVGIYLRNNKFVHASTSGGVMISDLDEAYYVKHYAGAGRVE